MCTCSRKQQKKEHPLLRFARGLSQPIVCSRIPQRTHVCVEWLMGSIPLSRTGKAHGRIATTSSAINAICSISRSSHRSVSSNRVSIVFILTRERKKSTERWILANINTTDGVGWIDAKYTSSHSLARSLFYLSRLSALGWGFSYSSTFRKLHAIQAVGIAFCILEVRTIRIFFPVWTGVYELSRLKLKFDIR